MFIKGRSISIYINMKICKLIQAGKLRLVILSVYYMVRIYLNHENILSSVGKFWAQQ